MSFSQVNIFVWTSKTFCQQKMAQLNHDVMALLCVKPDLNLCFYHKMSTVPPVSISEKIEHLF